MTGKDLKRSMRLILLTASVLISSTGCSTLFPPKPLECHVPNDQQKTSWLLLSQNNEMDDRYREGIDWIYSILEDDCFPEKAQEVRDD